MNSPPSNENHENRKPPTPRNHTRVQNLSLLRRNTALTTSKKTPKRKYNVHNNRAQSEANLKNTSRSPLSRPRRDNSPNQAPKRKMSPLQRKINLPLSKEQMMTVQSPLKIPKIRSGEIRPLSQKYNQQPSEAALQLQHRRLKQKQKKPVKDITKVEYNSRGIRIKGPQRPLSAYRNPQVNPQGTTKSYKFNVPSNKLTKSTLGGPSENKVKKNAWNQPIHRRSQSPVSQKNLKLKNNGSSFTERQLSPPQNVYKAYATFQQKNETTRTTIINPQASDRRYSQRHTEQLIIMTPRNAHSGTNSQYFRNTASNVRITRVSANTAMLPPKIDASPMKKVRTEQPRSTSRSIRVSSNSAANSRKMSLTPTRATNKVIITTPRSKRGYRNRIQPTSVQTSTIIESTVAKNIYAGYSSATGKVKNNLATQLEEISSSKTSKNSKKVIPVPLPQKSSKEEQIKTPIQSIDFHKRANLSPRELPSKYSRPVYEKKPNTYSAQRKSDHTKIQNSSPVKPPKYAEKVVTSAHSSAKKDQGLKELQEGNSQTLNPNSGGNELLNNTIYSPKRNRKASQGIRNQKKQQASPYMKGSFGPGLNKEGQLFTQHQSKFSETRHNMSISNSNFENKIHTSPVKPTTNLHQKQGDSPQFKNPFIRSEKKNETHFQQAHKLSSGKKQPEPILFRNVSDNYKDGSRYSGYKLGDQKHGFGVLLLSNGSKYEGDWKNDLMNGIGKLFYDNGAIAYEGGFSDNKVDGHGIMYNDQPKIPNYTSKHLADITRETNNRSKRKKEYIDFRDLSSISDFWLKFEGTFKEDMKQGTGKWFLSDGGMFVGEFQNDLANGRGMFIFGKSVEKLKRMLRNREFQDSMLIGGVPLRLGNKGEKIFGKWRDNKLVEIYNQLMINKRVTVVKQQMINVKLQL